MSFLQQTNEEYMKLQIRGLLSDPRSKKRLKKDLKGLGLYSRKQGFTIYRDFFKTELAPTRKSSGKTRATSFNVSDSHPRNKKKTKSELPSLTTVKVTRFKGLLNTEFFKRGKKTISSCVLSQLVSKIFVIPSCETTKIQFPGRYENEFSLKFVPFYLSSFICVVKNMHKIASGPSMHLTSDVKKGIGNTYGSISSILGSRKVYTRNKDFRLQSFIGLKPWALVISESLHKFFFKKYSIFNEQTFEDFVGNYLLSHNTLNQKRLCFDLYDKAGTGYLTTKHLYGFFESGIFQFIKTDLFVMVNFLCNDRYSEETERLRRQSTRIIESEVFKIIASEPKKLNFKAFCKLPFDQKFPDMILALTYLFFEDLGTNFLTNYYSITKYKVLPTGSSYHVVRPINICSSFLKVVKGYYTILKPKIQEFQPKSENFSSDLVQGAITTFFLGCNAEYLCEFKELAATASSLRDGSEFMFGKKCPLLMDTLYEHIRIPNTVNITLWDFIEHIEGFFDVLNI